MKRSSDMQGKMRDAGVPKSCWGTKVEESGRGWINDWAREIRSRFDDRESKSSMYVRYSSAYGLAMEAIELLARQSVVAGVPTKLTPFYRLVQLLKRGEFDLRQDGSDDTHRPCTVYDVFSKGVIAIPTIPLAAAIDCNANEYAEAIDFLVSHVYDGGVLVFAGVSRFSRSPAGEYPALFERMVNENCQIVEV